MSTPLATPISATVNPAADGGPATAPVGVPLRSLAVVCLVGIFGSIVAALVATTVFSVPLAYGVGWFLIFFGLYKLVIAGNQILGRRPGADGKPLLPPHFANPTVFWIYVWVKVAVWAVAWLAAMHLFTHPLAFVVR